MPPEVGVAPLAFVTIDDQYALNFDFLCTTHPASVIQGWIEEMRANGTKVLFSINDSKLGTVPDVDAFVSGVGAAGCRVGSRRGRPRLRAQLPRTEPDAARRDEDARAGPGRRARDGSARDSSDLGAMGGGEPQFLAAFAAELDFVTTMDYTPWPGVEQTISNFGQYAQAIGAPEKIAIGMSCMGPSGSHLETVVRGLRGRRYTFSYDVTSRKGSGATFTKTILASLP
jgi:hypothetical protein